MSNSHKFAMQFGKFDATIINMASTKFHRKNLLNPLEGYVNVFPHCKMCCGLFLDLFFNVLGDGLYKIGQKKALHSPLFMISISICV